MRTKSKFIKSTTFTVLFLAVFVMGSYAQTVDERDRAAQDQQHQDRDRITQSIQMTTPSDGEQNVERGTPIEITFSEDMELDEETIHDRTFVLKEKRSDKDKERERDDEMRRDRDDDMQREQEDMEHDQDEEFQTDQQRRDQERGLTGHDEERTIEGTVEIENNTVKFIPNQTLRAHTEYTLTMNGVDVGFGEARQQDRDMDHDQQRRQQDQDQERVQQDRDQERGQDRDRDMAQTRMDQDWSVTFTTGGREEPLERVDLGAAADYVVLGSEVHGAEESQITGAMGKKDGEREDRTGGIGDIFNGDTDDNGQTGQTGQAGQRQQDQDRQRQDQDRQQQDRQQATGGDPDQALQDMETAYNDLEGRTNPDFEDVFEGKISGKTLTEGLYKFNNSIEIDSTVTLIGDEDDIWIFQVADDLDIRENVRFQLEDGANAENVFWQVAGNISVGSESHVEGVLLTMNEINLDSNASVSGRLLAQSDVNLNEARVNEPEFRADRIDRTGRTGPDSK